jgi:hypothetical protein
MLETFRNTYCRYHSEEETAKDVKKSTMEDPML